MGILSRGRIGIISDDENSSILNRLNPFDDLQILPEGMVEQDYLACRQLSLLASLDPAENRLVTVRKGRPHRVSDDSDVHEARIHGTSRPFDAQNMW